MGLLVVVRPSKTLWGRSDVDVVLVIDPEWATRIHRRRGPQCRQARNHHQAHGRQHQSLRRADRRGRRGVALLLGVDYQSRYVDNNYRVAEALRQGLLGKPILGEVRFKWFRSQEYFEHSGGWRGTWAMDGGGSLANQGSHLIDLLLWFMGVPKTVYGETAIMNHDIRDRGYWSGYLNF